ncbi:hypothetical protein BRAS3809_5240011 [Bradyrhizobium sp. STM 3809]|nr:hypothetical protein BRAS3809_5240011 [Bradyrhizobium sp. STM 3809]
MARRCARHAGTLRRTRTNDLDVLTTNLSRYGKVRSGGFSQGRSLATPAGIFLILFQTFK